MSESYIEEHKEQLEMMAVMVLTDIMNSSIVDPKVRVEAAGDVLKAVGKDAPPKQAAGTVVFNFGEGLKSAVAGMGELQSLFMRPVGCAIAPPEGKDE